MDNFIMLLLGFFLGLIFVGALSEDKEKIVEYKIKSHNSFILLLDDESYLKTDSTTFNLIKVNDTIEDRKLVKRL